MKRWMSACLACGLVALLPPARAADDDPVRAKLDKANAAFDIELEKFREAVAAHLDKREDAARADGDKKLVDQIKAERQTFEVRAVFPPTLAPTAVQSLALAKAKLEAAHRAAVKEYTQEKNDAAAGAVEQQLDKVRRTAFGVTVSEWVRMRLVGRWRRAGDNQVFEFRADGTLAETSAANLPVTTGKWAVGKDGVGAVPLANGWGFIFTLTEENAMTAPARNPRGQPEGTWQLRKIEP